MPIIGSKRHIFNSIIVIFVIDELLFIIMTDKRADNHPLVSVVVPVYGIERYIGACLESLIKQSWKNLQIIVVDDGSPDHCAAICDLYAGKDPRIKVIHKPNGGIVTARQAGLEAAEGEFVSYVDGDDWVGTGFIETLVRTMIAEDADIVSGGYVRDVFGKTIHYRENSPCGVYEGESLLWLQKRMMSCGNVYEPGLSTYPWNKLYRKDILSQVQFDIDKGLSIGEDAVLVYASMMLVHKVVIVDTAAYHYRQRDDSMLKSAGAATGNVEKLRRLYNNLSSFSPRYDKICNWSKQVVDFMLGISIMQLGDESCFIPSDKVGSRLRIAICKAGTFGQHLYTSIKQKGVCEIVSWVDEDFWEYRRCGLDVDPLESLPGADVDYVLVASLENQIKGRLTELLYDCGIPASRILKVRVEDDRKAQLERFLK